MKISLFLIIAFFGLITFTSAVGLRKSKKALAKSAEYPVADARGQNELFGEDFERKLLAELKLSLQNGQVTPAEAQDLQIALSQIQQRLEDFQQNILNPLIARLDVGDYSPATFYPLLSSLFGEEYTQRILNPLIANLDAGDYSPATFDPLLSSLFGEDFTQQILNPLISKLEQGDYSQATFDPLLTSLFGVDYTKQIIDPLISNLEEGNVNQETLDPLLHKLVWTRLYTKNPKPTHFRYTRGRSQPKRH